MDDRGWSGPAAKVLGATEAVLILRDRARASLTKRHEHAQRFEHPLFAANVLP